MSQPDQEQPHSPCLHSTNEESIKSQEIISIHITLRILMQVNVMESYSSGLTAVKLLLHHYYYFKLFQIISNSCNSFSTWRLQDSARQADSDLESPMMPHPVKGSDQRLQFRLRFQWPKLPEPHAKHWGNSEPREILWHLGDYGSQMVTKWIKMVPNPCVKKSVTKVAWKTWNFWLESTAPLRPSAPKAPWNEQQLSSIPVRLRHRRVLNNAKHKAQAVYAQFLQFRK